MQNKIRLVHDDITKIAADAIVNAANSSLLGGDGVDGAIHRVGGEDILNECKLIREAQGGCKTGQAVVTSAGHLPAKYVIHTVGPVWHGDDPEEITALKDCYIACLTHAEKLNCRSIAFPNISTGAYHFPKYEAARIAIDTVKEMLSGLHYVQEIIFVCYDMENFAIYQDMLAEFDDV